MAISNDEQAVLAAVKTAVLALSDFGTGSVVISPALAPSVLASTRSPCAIIRPASGITDEDEPGIVQQDFEVVVAVFGGGDATGEATMLGAGGSDGLLRTGRTMVNAVQKLWTSQPVVCTARGPVVAELDEKSRYIAWRAYRFRAVCANETDDA